jgi:hypothetical protein
MRLLHTRELRFEEFFDDQIPDYAILSHRWGDGEISYQTLNSVIEMPSSDPKKLTHRKLSGPGFDKIRNFRQKVGQSWDWVWIDTCCINKESSAELSEAINLMYRWYKYAKTCYIYLSDVECAGRAGQRRNTDVIDEVELQQIKASQWFTRGWTLQELLAPRTALFFDKNWSYIGARVNPALCAAISQTTGIERDFIVQRKRLDQACVAKKMSWLSMRRTSRIEDIAYCVLGLFGVNMPLLYGEGRKAFMRLQLELIRKDDDESIFAWNMKGALEIKKLYYMSIRGLLAFEPSLFSTSGNICSFPLNDRIEDRPPYTMKNQGLQFQNARTSKSFNSRTLFLRLNCYEQISEGVSEPITLELTPENSVHDKYWRRIWDYDFRSGSITESYESFPIPIYIRQYGM